MTFNLMVIMTWDHHYSHFIDEILVYMTDICAGSTNRDSIEGATKGKQREGFVVCCPGAVCILVLILHPQEGLPPDKKWIRYLGDLI